MSDDIEAAAGQAGNNWIWVAQPSPSDPSPLSCFLAMDEAIATAAPFVHGEQIAVPCQKPWFEFTLIDDMSVPIAGALCNLRFPEGAGRSARTDDDGLAHFSDVKVDTSTLTTILFELIGADGRLGYEADIVPQGEAPPANVEEEAVQPEIIYFDLAWHDRN